MNLLLAGVMHSPNIGDGVIADCFCAAAPSSARITRLDLAGRQGYANTGEGAARQRILAVLDALPDPLANATARQLVGAQIRRRLVPLLPQALNDIDGVLIGGGQLLADANLNFPLKINRIAKECVSRGIPYGIHSVGVALRWSAPAARLFAEVLGHPDLCFLSVRDVESRENLMRHLNHLGLGHIAAPQVFPDPGFLASSVLGSEYQPGPHHRVGLGITDPAAILRHGGTRGIRNWPVWYAACARALIKQGMHVTLFTNGAFEDEACLAQTQALLRNGNDTQISHAQRPTNPAELARLISGFDTVVSHRLHASIVAYSCGVIPVGLPWDKKLEGFFSLIGRQQNLMQVAQPEPQALAHAVSEMPPLDRIRQAHLHDRTRTGIHAAVKAFAHNSARRSCNCHAQPRGACLHHNLRGQK